MKGKSKENEIFGFCGPDYLNNVDWRVPDHRRSIAASLVQGVYVLERDRQKCRIKHKAVAPIWWEFFNFNCIQTLEDQCDESTFGAIFENQLYNPSLYDHIAPQHRPPKYIIAFRGTMLKIDTIFRDLFLDAKLALNMLSQRSSRYQISIKAVEGIISKAGARNVWLAGHSLGAAIALQVGKEMARRGCYIETYLFNPPYAIAPLEKLANSTQLKIGIRFVNSVVIAGLSVALKGRPRNNCPNHMAQHYDQFSILGPWIPYLFVNQNDLISCEYIGYFEHREKTEAWGAGGIERIAAKDTILSLVSDGEAIHLIPSAVVVKNISPMKDKLKLTHGIQQWWQDHQQWQPILYHYNH